MSARLTAGQRLVMQARVDSWRDGASFDATVGLEGKRHGEDVERLLAEIDALRAERAPAVSRDAGEALYAALEELGVADDLDSAAVERAAVHVERYGERREEAGAEGEREQRAIERQGGPGR